MEEIEVEKIVRDYIKIKYTKEDGWNISNYCRYLKKKGEQGVDITLWNQKRGDRLVIEVKKWSNTNAANHNNFYQVFGQLLSRIDKVPSKNYANRRKMIIAAPSKFIELIKKKIHSKRNNSKGMKGGWEMFGRLVNLRIWQVNMKTKDVIEYHWKDLLK